MSFYSSYPYGGAGVRSYSTLSAFPPASSFPAGTLAVALDTGYVYETNGTVWFVVAGPGNVLTIGALDGQPPAAVGATISLDTLYLQSATNTFPGLVNNTTQTFAGNKTFTGSISASNLSGTNTGNVSITTANGLSLVGQALSLAQATISTPGAVANVGGANGVVPLDGSAKIPVTYLPSVVMEYQGAWNPNTNTPALVDGTGTNGFVYYVSALRLTPVSGLTDPSMTNFQIGDLVIYSNVVNKYQLASPAAGVQSVNGAQGAVTVNAINQLTGDGTAGPASGSASAALTLATVNSNTGAFGSATNSGSFTVNAKGLITAASSVPIQIAESQVTNLVSDLAGKQPVGNYITALTGDVAATGPGSVAATIQPAAVTLSKMANLPANTVIGNDSGSSAVPAALTLSSGATPTSVVYRDSNGNFMSNNFSRSFSSITTTGGTLTFTATTPGFVRFTGSSAQTVVFPATSTAGIGAGFQYTIFNSTTAVITIEDSSLTVIGSMATGSYITFTAMDSASPGTWLAQYVTTRGNVAVTGLTGDVTATGPGSVAATLATVNSNVGTFSAATVTVNAKGLVTAAASGSIGQVPPTMQTFTSGSGTYNKNYTFIVSNANATIGATYTNNGVTFTVAATVTLAGRVVMSGSAPPASSGVLTHVTGTGDAAINFSSVFAPLYITVEMAGGGGAGGGAGSTAAAAAAGSGGNAGAYLFKTITAPANTYAYAVGAGGTVGTAGNNPGGTGGTTTFGSSFLTAVGGTGGNGSAASATANIVAGPPATSSATGGDLNVMGGAGGAGYVFNGTTGAAPGFGGANRLSANTYIIAGATAPGVTGNSYGGGGSGGSTVNGGTAQQGGAGAAGIIMVREFYS